jgi:hypothetical protein
MLGFGVDTALLIKALEAAGIDASTAEAFAELADMDLDGDGVDETVSMAFAFTAVGCGLE